MIQPNDPGVRRGSPSVTVIVTAHRRRDFLREALESVVNQSIPSSEVEVILVMGYKDSAIEDFADAKSIKVFHAEGSMGDSLASAIRRANAPIVTFLDDDDAWAPNRLELVSSAFASFPNAVYYHNAVQYVNRSGRRVDYSRAVEPRRSSCPAQLTRVVGPPNRTALSRALDSAADFNLSSIAVTRPHALAALPLVSELTSGPDALFFFTACLSGSDLLIDGRRLTRYRISETNVSRARDPVVKAEELGRLARTLRIIESRAPVGGRGDFGPVRRQIREALLSTELLQAIFDPVASRELVLMHLMSLLKTPGVPSILKRRSILLGSAAIAAGPRLASSGYLRWSGEFSRRSQRSESREQQS